MVSYNGGEPFPEVVIKPIDVYEAKLKPQFVKANVESQDGEDGGGMSFWDKIRPDSEQPAGMTIYGDADGNDGPGGGYSAKYQYKSIDMSYTYGIISVVKFAIILNKWIHPRSPYPEGYFDINEKGLDSVTYTIDSGNVAPSMGDDVLYKVYYKDGIEIDSGAHWEYNGIR